MGESTASEPAVRVLGLGNEILSDDAVGLLVAREVRRLSGGAVEVLESSEAGFGLLGDLSGVLRLLVVDCIQTGKSPPGAIHIFSEQETRPLQGLSPHFVGLFEVLEVARLLGLTVPTQVKIVGIEAADCLTVGGAMHPDVAAAIPRAAALIAKEACHG